MKKVFLILILIFSLNSCSENYLKNDLIGNWKSTKSANVIELTFDKDTLISNMWGNSTRFLWESDTTNIYYTQLTNVDPELETDFILEYRFNLEKDTLYLKKPDSDFSNEFVRFDNDN